MADRPASKRRSSWRGIVALVLLIEALVALPYLVPWQHQDGTVPAQPFAESRFVEVGGSRLHARDWRAWPPRRGCDVLLLAGRADSTFAWRDLAPALARSGRRTVALDRPGSGYSDRTPLPESAETPVLWQALDALGGTSRPWCLVGHGDAARAVAAMLAAQPDRVVAVTYVDGTPLRDASRVHPGWRRALLATSPGRRWLAGTLARDEFSVAAVTARLQREYGREPMADEVAGHRAPLLVPGTARSLVDASRFAPSADVSPDVLASKPTLVIWGRDDVDAAPEVGGALVHAIRGATPAPLARAAHRPMETSPKATRVALLQWFDELTAARR